MFAESAVDVVRVVRFARSQGMRIAPQNTGHGALALESLQGALLLKTSRMRQVDISPATRTARAHAGAQREYVAAPAAAVELVTPDGRLARADADHEPELLWAAKGGGGSVGVVTALEMTLYPVPEMYAGALFVPIERSSEVLHGWRNWTDTVPDELTSLARLVRVPAVPEAPAALRGRAVVGVEAAYVGDSRDGDDLIRPLRELGPELDTLHTIPAPAVAQLNMDPETPTPVAGDGAFLADLPPAAIDAILALAGPGIETPLASIEIRHLGGALARDAAGGGAQPKIEANYVILGSGLAPSPELYDTVRVHFQALKHSLAPWRAGYDYYNFIDTPAEANVLLPAASYERLQEIKAAYDPDQTIISNHPVRPAGD